MESKEVRGLIEAYASIYEGYGKDKKKKKMHDCATHGEHSEWGAGLMIKEMHTLDEDGNVTHYDVMFEHGIEKNVPVEELNITMSEKHEHFINYDKNAEVLGESDIFDAILEHLVSEGYADTNEAAIAIMANMSEEWRQDIVEGLDKEFNSMRKRGGASAPEDQRSIGGQANRRNKDYWADTLGKNRDRGKGNKAKRRAAELG